MFPTRSRSSPPLIALTLILLTGCSGPDSPRSAPASSPTAKLLICVPIAPIATFVREVGGDAVDVTVLVPAGQSMHSYDPTPRQVAGLANARIYFELGLPFERKITAAVRERDGAAEVVDLRTGVQMRRMEAHEVAPHEAHDHAGGEAHAHEHEGHTHVVGEEDPHLWLSPRTVKRVAQTICEALQKADPARLADYAHNLASFQQKLDELDQQMREELAPLRGRAVYVFHPSYGYFCDDHGLRQVPVEIAGREPTAKELTDLIARAKADGVRAIFVQPQFSRKSAEALAQQVGAAVVPLDPLAEDYLNNLRTIGTAIAANVAAKPAAK